VADFEIGCICVGNCGNIIPVFGLNPAVCVCVYVCTCVYVLCICLFIYKIVVKYRKVNVIQIKSNKEKYVQVTKAYRGEEAQLH
jgi:membrane protein YdbS with pleckstrin-like domain